MRPEKEAMAEEIFRQVESARTIVVANYVGLKAQELEEFRNILKPLSSDCMVVKNTLLSRVLAKANLPSVDEHLTGSTAIIFGKGDDVMLAKRVVAFSKDHEPLKIKVGILERDLITKAQLSQLASLPGREVLIAHVVGTLRAPLVSFVYVLSAVQRGFVIALAAVRDKKEEAEKASAAASPAPEVSPAASNESTENKA